MEADSRFKVIGAQKSRTKNDLRSVNKPTSHHRAAKQHVQAQKIYAEIVDGL
jgi:hypothetical protein